MPGEGALISPYLISENFGHSISYISHSSTPLGRMVSGTFPWNVPGTSGNVPQRAQRAKMCEIGPYILYLSLKCNVYLISEKGKI